jgi:diadenosine tetraphosphate (Ap4A) HIT family hydrolase
MLDWREDRIGAAHRGENPMVMARMRSGFAVVGDTQWLPGYCVLLSEDPRANHLTDLGWSARARFLFDLALLGEAVENTCQPNGLSRINYEVLGNSLNFLHGHVFARYRWEPADKALKEVGCYPLAIREAPANAYSDAEHGQLRASITTELERLMAAAYPEVV